MHLRSDNNPSVQDRFCTHALNRLTDYATGTAPATCTDPGAKHVDYDALGNVTTKSDVGTYTYPAPGAAQPHAVSSIAASYTHDSERIRIKQVTPSNTHGLSQRLPRDGGEGDQWHNL